MNDDRFLNPITGDFDDDDNGTFLSDDVIMNKLAFSFMIAKGSWEGDPELGHEFDKLARATDTAQNRRLLEMYARSAVKWLVDDGYLDSVEAVVESFQPGLIAFLVIATKAGRQIKAGPFLVPYGAG